METVVKSTINLSAALKNELNEYVERKLVSSFSSGVNAAIELYLKELRREEYDRLMEAASRDQDFMARTLECQKELEPYDARVGEEW
ncbi:MAG: hypothetical protein LBT20_00905 [Clostridiales bacterium]|jgi:metal-responsive CopG/Arc/MetJ family transcriptional regulator|nr:hypothetical protein [Clostridiales bacterium]